MSEGKKFTDIDDIGNIENIIKKFDPAFNDIAKRLPGSIANFAQQEMHMAITENDDNREGKTKAFHLWLNAKGKSDGN